MIRLKGKISGGFEAVITVPADDWFTVKVDDHHHYSERADALERDDTIRIGGTLLRISEREAI